MPEIDHEACKREIEAQERRLQFNRFGFDEAWRIGQALVAAAPAPIAIRIDLAGRTLFVAALDGTAPDNDIWLDLKFAAVRQFGHSSLWLHHHLRARQRTLAETLSALVPMADHGGGFPIRIDGQVMGAIGVSGLPHEEDHRIIVDTLERER